MRWLVGLMMLACSERQGVSEAGGLDAAGAGGVSGAGDGGAADGGAADGGAAGAPAACGEGTTPCSPLAFRVSSGADVMDANGKSQAPAISADGRSVAFESQASNLVSDDHEGHQDVFVYREARQGVERVSVTASGEGGDATSHRPALSADGRYVVFHSYARNLVEPALQEGVAQVFVRDLELATTTRVSVDAEGSEGNFHSDMAVVSADGRWVFFESLATNLVTPDGNLGWDVFVADRDSAAIERLSQGQQGEPADGDCGPPTISSDGRFVLFPSLATNLVELDTNQAQDVYLVDREQGTLERVSVGKAGEQGNGPSYEASVSNDGRWIVFSSTASNLVPDDDNGSSDIFLRDRDTAITERVSVSSSGAQGNGSSQVATLAPDGRLVVFQSAADNLVPGDDNQAEDIFVRDLIAKQTFRLSGSDAGGTSNGPSLAPTISAQGEGVAFVSLASNLVTADRNGTWDVFLAAPPQP